MSNDQSLVKIVEDSQRHFYLNIFNSLTLSDVEEITHRMTTIPEKYAQDEEFLIELVRTNPVTFQCIPKQTSKIVEEALKKAGVLIFRHINKEFITQELCFQMVKKSSYCLRHVPTEFMNQELCLLAFQKEQASLFVVPDKYRTYELCLLAMKNKGGHLKLVPEDLRDLDMCLTALENDPNETSYSRVPICPNQTHWETLLNLRQMKQIRDNQNLIKSTIEGISK